MRISSKHIVHNLIFKHVIGFSVKEIPCVLRNNRLRFRHTYLFKMDKAYLRQLEGTDQFHMTFRYVNSDLKVDRQFNFCRQYKENASTFLGRVNANVEKVIMKKNKKKKQEKMDAASKLFLNGSLVENDVICESLFKTAGSNLVLKVLENEYAIVINSPWVDEIALPTSILANFHVYPSKFVSVFTDQSASEFNWYRSSDKNSWTHVGSGFIYLPSNQDINSYLKIGCIPKSGESTGPAVEAESLVRVEASPGLCPFENRHQFTKQRAVGDEFRVVSYNILADLYCDSDFSRTVLFPYCPPYALNIDYRKQLILKELLGYNADIICLQELDRKVYVNDVEPVFNSLNYGSTFQLKGGTVAEGLGCIFNKDRFKFLEGNCVILSQQINEDPIYADIWEKVSQNGRLVERVLPRTTAVQTTALEAVGRNEILLVANTHLYFHPDSDHIRLLQGGLAIRYIEDVISKLKEKTNKRISLIFCGDFNSDPNCGIFQLYTTGSVSQDCIDWESNKEEAVKNLNLSQPFQLQSACGTPQFTNFTAGFSGCLDYIYYEKTCLEVTQVVPLPTIEEITENTAIPSIVFPSDHVALVSDLKWM